MCALTCSEFYSICVVLAGGFSHRQSCSKVTDLVRRLKLESGVGKPRLVRAK